MKNRFWNVFGPDGKALVIAFDHAIDGSSKYPQDPYKVFTECRKGGCDAFLTTYGLIKNYRQCMGHAGIFLRNDPHGTHDAKSACEPGARYDVNQLDYLGVDGVMSGIPSGVVGSDGKDYDMIATQNVAREVQICDAHGLLVGAEVLPNGSADPTKFTPGEMKTACRTAAEAGADFIKCIVYKGFKEVADSTYIPVLALGGAYNSDERIVLEYVRMAMDEGCKGLVVGRNAWSHPEPAKMVRAMSRIIHDDATVDEALEEFK